MKIAIYGYGNIGRGVECAVKDNPDMELSGVFTRRDPECVHTLTGVPVYPASQIDSYAEKIDVLILCGGSATDLPEMTPALARRFHVVDSFDTHKRIPEHFANVDTAAKETGHVAVISGGWDPGLFSLARVYASSVIPGGKHYTFWGRGVSQGHSDAIRRIPGVLDARQYTVPVEEALTKVRDGEMPELSAGQKHLRECWVVAAPDADRAKIERSIKTMPNYFSDYDTTVNFITQEEMDRDHSQMPHGGSVIHTGTTGLCGEHRHTVEFSLKLDSNPEFTAGVLAALARAAYRMAKKGETGCKTMLDIPPALLSPWTEEQLREQLL